MFLVLSRASDIVVLSFSRLNFPFGVSCVTISMVIMMKLFFQLFSYLSFSQVPKVIRVLIQ